MGLNLPRRIPADLYQHPMRVDRSNGPEHDDTAHRLQYLPEPSRTTLSRSQPLIPPQFQPDALNRVAWFAIAVQLEFQADDQLFKYSRPEIG